MHPKRGSRDSGMWLRTSCSFFPLVLHCLAFYSHTCMSSYPNPHMNIFVWNCNRTSSRRFSITLKDLMCCHKPEILALVETRCSGEHANVVCNNMCFDHLIRVEALGYSGGIWILKNDSVTLWILKTHPQFIHAEVSSPPNQPWLLTIIYGSPNQSLRKNLWKDLNQNTYTLKDPWMIVKGFNSIIDAEETTNPENFNHRRYSNFVQ